MSTPKITTAHAQRLNSEGFRFIRHEDGMPEDTLVLIFKLVKQTLYQVQKDGKPVKASSLPADPYLSAGFESRREYLDDLADQYGVDPSNVYMMAELLGPNEDFDGLVTALEDGLDF